MIHPRVATPIRASHTQGHRAESLRRLVAGLIGEFCSSSNEPETSSAMRLYSAPGCLFRDETRVFFASLVLLPFMRGRPVRSAPHDRRVAFGARRWCP